MAIEAPMSKFKLNNYKIYIVVCILIAVVFAYDGYLSKYEWSHRQKFYQEHFIDNDNQPDSTIKGNQIAPFALIALAALIAIRYAMVKDTKVVADETSLIIGKKVISYDSIEKIDKTNFDSKGYFAIGYKDESGGESEIKLSDRSYDDLKAVLDELVTKIS